MNYFFNGFLFSTFPHFGHSVDLEKLLGKFSQELKFIFITSGAKVLPEIGEGEETELEGLKVRVNKTLNKKCERCWHSRPEVGSINDHPHLCSRCLENIEGNGETRLYA